MWARCREENGVARGWNGCCCCCCCWIFLYLIEYYCWDRSTTSGCSRASLATTSATEVLISRKLDAYKREPFCCRSSRASLAGNSENEASCSDAWNSLFEASLGARRVDKKWQNIRMKFGKKLLRCVRGFTSFLHFAFWGFPRCQAGFILADLSASTSCFFNFQNFEYHIWILITFVSKAANCDYRLRIFSKSATLSIRYKILIFVQGFSSVPFKT